MGHLFSTVSAQDVFSWISSPFFIVGAFVFAYRWFKRGGWLPTYIHVIAAITFAGTWAAFRFMFYRYPPETPPSFWVYPAIALLFAAIVYFVFILYGGADAAWNDESEHACRERKTMRVLVVDDEPNIVRFVQVHLTRHGFVVETAGDGAEALTKAQANPPDVLVTDVMMPNMGGFELIKALHADPHFAALKIIVMTATANDRPREEVEKGFAKVAADWGVNWGVSCFIGKPFHPAELIQIVIDLTEQKPLERMLY